ncbi:unnamed protein product [Ceratitis capitata]|nr:unnamed protein product [Ceratitis capitata]
MRIFGKLLQTLRLSRRQSNFKPRRYASTLSYLNFARRPSFNNRAFKNVTVRSMGSKSGSSSKGSKSNLSSILPVALIQSKSPTTSTKIMLIPLHFFDGDDEANNRALKTLSIIREHAKQIEAFTENVLDAADSHEHHVPLAGNNANKAMLEQYTGQDDVTLGTHDEDASNSTVFQDSHENSNISLYEKLERAVAEQEINRTAAHDCFEAAAWNTKRNLVVYVPDNLEEKLKQMAIASMQLVFEMDMSNIQDAIFRSAALEKINLFKPPTPKTLEDPTVTMKASLDMDTSETTGTIPLDFNAMIQGTVEIDPSKYTPNDLGEIKVPEFNESVTTIAANICSTALQKGFPADISRMSYSTKSPAECEDGKESPKRNPHIVCVREGSKGCISPGNAEYPNFVPRSGTDAVVGSQEATESDKACISSEISLLKSSEIIDSYTSRGLMSCKAYAKALIEATKRRAEMAKKKSEPNNKSKSHKKEAIKKKDKCGDPKNNPCTKPLVDECGNELKKDCPTRKKKEKKGDPCKGKDDPCKKASSKGKGKDNCTTPGVPQPCAGKKQKKKPSDGKKKKNICGNDENTGNRCNSESDACKIEKECPKPKKKKCDLGDPCKDPCLNVNDRPDKNKKEFSSGKDNKLESTKSLCDMEKSVSPTSLSAMSTRKCKSAADIKQTESKCTSTGKKDNKKSGSSDNECKPFNSVTSKKAKSKCGSEGKLEQKAKNICDVKKSTEVKSKSSAKEECKRFEGICKNKRDKSPCSAEKQAPKKTTDTCSSTRSKSKTKCKTIKNLCDLKKSKSCDAVHKKTVCKTKDESKTKSTKSICEEKKTKPEGACKSKDDSKSKPAKIQCDAKKLKPSESESTQCKSQNASSKGDTKGECQKKKSTAPNCKTKPGSGAKKYSTFGNTNTIVDIFPIKRFFSSVPMSSVPRGFISWRRLSSKKSSKGKKKGGKSDASCMKSVMKTKTKRIDKLERRKPKNCFTDPDDCQEKLCKDPAKSDCATHKKENENPTPLSLRSRLQIIGPVFMLNKRSFGSNSCKETDTRCYDDTKRNYEYRKERNCEENTDDDDNDTSLLNETRNEVIRIMEPCTVERCLEAIPSFSEYDILVRTEAVALSGSDLHYYETGGKSYPGMTLGHDATGIVQEVGCSITKIRPGDRVVLESGLACGICDYCKKGCYNICNNLIFNGFLRKYQVHPADLCHKIPDDVDTIEATLTQTLALGCQACFKAQILPTTNVLVIGAGSTAISTALCARAIGAGNICVASTLKEPLETIEKTFNFNCLHYEADMQYCTILECLYSVLHDWPDAVINCAVSEKTMNLSVMALKPCGVCVLAECDAECACFNAMDVLMKNLKLIPSFRSINMFPTALHLIEDGKAPIGRLIANIFQWQEVEHAFRKALHESNVGNRKVIVRCAEPEEDETFKKEDCKT